MAITRAMSRSVKFPADSAVDTENTISEDDDGTFTFDVALFRGVTDDLRVLLFDLKNPGKLAGVSVPGASDQVNAPLIGGGDDNLDDGQGDEIFAVPPPPGTGPEPVPIVIVGNTPSGDQRIDGLLNEYKWYSGSTITYSDPDSIDDYPPGYSDAALAEGRNPLAGFSQVSAQQMVAVHFALDNLHYTQPLGAAGFSVEGFTNLNISYAGSGLGSGTILVANSSDAGTAYAARPSLKIFAGDAFFGQGGDFPKAGNYDWQTVLHEIGHTLGLKHGNDTDLYGALPNDYDSLEYSVMTYRSFVGDDTDGYNNGFWSYPQTYMMLDIAALQYMYGADYTTNSDPTVYTWNPITGKSYVNGNLAIDPGGNRIFETIWDGGGIDTYDLSNYRTDLKIDLRPGEYSIFSSAQLAYLGGGPNGGYARGNVFNALLHFDESLNDFDRRSLIENAIGGRGNDTIIGNEASNVLNGGLGADKMDGGDGDDFYIVDNVSDEVKEVRGDTQGGFDTVQSSITYTLSANIENLTLTASPSITAPIGWPIFVPNINGTGNAKSNQITGNSGNNVLSGLGGTDWLYGQAGNDTLNGGEGKDTLSGGFGADKYVFKSAAQADGDFIYDFRRWEGDKIDVSAIDANAGTPFNDDFLWVGTGPFTAPGQLRYDPGGSYTHLQGNIDTNLTADFTIDVGGRVSFISTDFIGVHSAFPLGGGWILS